MSLKSDALKIINHAINCSDPFENTKKILESLDIINENITVFSIGKAAVPMARAAECVLGDKIKTGLLVTKYNHASDYNSPAFNIIESGHPVSDENSLIAAEKALSICKNLTKQDTLIVLLSGGGSALFEKSVLPAEKQRMITNALLKSGADINSINAIRRRISLVKGGKLAAAAYPAKVYTIALSDVLNNDKCTIASGITVSDSSSVQEVFDVIDKYIPQYKEYLSEFISNDDNININDAGFYFAGDINSLCQAAEEKAYELGYEVFSGTRQLCGEAKYIACDLIENTAAKKGKHAYVYGGETTVTIKGSGLGGRNQEMALQAAIKLKEKENILFASVGSDGTDGPTDAAGGIVDSNTYEIMKENGISPENELKNNNSYYALSSADSLIITGPTGTNVNDLTIILTEN